MNESKQILQWRNRLERGTYTAVLLINAGVVSSSLTWNNVFSLCQAYRNLRNHFSTSKKMILVIFLAVSYSRGESGGHFILEFRYFAVILHGQLLFQEWFEFEPHLEQCIFLFGRPIKITLKSVKKYETAAKSSKLLF